MRINLLPPETRKASPAGTLSLPLRPLGIGAGAFLTALTLFLIVGNAWNAGQLGRLRREWQELQPQRAGLEQKQLQLQMLQGQAGVLGQVKAPEGRWAPRLNLLSDAAVPQVWYRKLRVGAGGPARLEGSALVEASGGREAAVTQFLQKLKSQPAFQQLFSGTELQSMEHRSVGQEDVVDFVILLKPTG